MGARGSEGYLLRSPGSSGVVPAGSKTSWSFFNASRICFLVIGGLETSAVPPLRGISRNIVQYIKTGDLK